MKFLSICLYVGIFSNFSWSNSQTLNFHFWHLCMSLFILCCEKYFSFIFAYYWNLLHMIQWHAWIDIGSSSIHVLISVWKVEWNMRDDNFRYAICGWYYIHRGHESWKFMDNQDGPVMFWTYLRTLS
jgi:hypothetical protein